MGLTVIITDDPLLPETASAPAMLAPPAADGHRAAQSYRWQPEKSPSGPVSIVVSGRDRRMIVIRNGVEIGSSSIRIDGRVSTTEAFTLSGIDGAGFHWLRLPLPGQAPDAAKDLTSADVRAVICQSLSGVPSLRS